MVGKPRSAQRHDQGVLGDNDNQGHPNDDFSVASLPGMHYILLSAKRVLDDLSRRPNLSYDISYDKRAVGI